MYHAHAYFSDASWSPFVILFVDHSINGSVTYLPPEDTSWSPFFAVPAWNTTAFSTALAASTCEVGFRIEEMGCKIQDECGSRSFDFQE